MLVFITLILGVCALIGMGGTLAIRSWVTHLSEKMAHQREMMKLQEVSDENAHRRYMQVRREDEKAQLPEKIRVAELESITANHTADAEKARARAAELEVKRELERERNMHRHR